MGKGVTNLSIYVITVAGFDDRQRSINSQLQSLGLPYTFILRHDPIDFEKDPPPIKFVEGTVLSPGEQSAVAKHAEAWRLGYQKGPSLTLVLEDDALITKNFKQRLQETLQATERLEAGFLINIGCANARPPPDFNNSRELLRVAPIETAESYLTDHLGLKRRLDWLEKNPVSLPADHLIKLIDADLRTTQYWTKSPLVEQGSLKGRFVSSLDKKRAAASPLLIHFGYLFRKYKRRVLPHLLSTSVRRDSKNAKR
jgi:glycosyl transferase family 25